MAYLKQAKTEDEIKKMTLSGVKKAYNELASDYIKITEGRYIHCGKCGEFISRDNFYSSEIHSFGVFPICKRCLLAMVEQREKKNDKAQETKESVKRVLRMMDLPYVDSLYESACESVSNEVGEKNRSAPFLQYITMIKSLRQYKGKTWENSEFEPGMNDAGLALDPEVVATGRRRFGRGYSDEDYMFLESEYQDWIQRYLCEDKAQELLFKRICFKELDIDKAQKAGRDTKELDKSLQDLMGSLNVKPSQKNSSSISDQKTFGQLIEVWEKDKPIPEPDEEFKDVDKIGLYIDVFFKGHLSKMMGLKNAFSSLYDRFMAKYTVTKPQYDEDADAEILFEQIFGSRMDDD